MWGFNVLDEFNTFTNQRKATAFRNRSRPERTRPVYVLPRTGRM